MKGVLLLINFNPSSGLIHNVEVSITYSEKQKNRSTFGLKGKELYYEKPFRVYENTTITAKEINDRLNAGNVVVGTESKDISNVDLDAPPAPILTGVTEGGRYNSVSLNISNKSALYDYVIELNGKPYTLGSTVSESGKYAFVVTCKKKTNYKTSSATLTFEIIRKDTFEAPSIFYTPERTLNKDVRVSIIYSRKTSINEYKIGNGAWTAYSGAFTITQNDTIYARSINSVGEINESNITVSNIDNTPPDAPIIYGIEPDSIQTHAFPTVHKKRNHNYAFELNGKPYELYTPITNFARVKKTYTFKVTATKKWNGKSTSATKTFTIDTIPPMKPEVIGITPNNFGKEFIPKLSFKEVGVKYTACLNGVPFDIEADVNPFPKTTNRSDDFYIITVTATKLSNNLKSSSFIYFELNNNASLNIISPNRVIFKPLYRENKKLRAIADELVVDQYTGHIYLTDSVKDSEGDLKLKNITETVEKMIPDRDIQLSYKYLPDLNKRLEYQNNVFIYLRERMTNLEADNARVKAELDISEADLNRLKGIIDSNASLLSDLENKMNNLETGLTNTNNLISIIRTSFQGVRDKAIQKIYDLYENGSILARNMHYEYLLEEVILTKVTREQFNQFKTDEMNKYNAFKKKIDDFHNS